MPTRHSLSHTFLVVAACSFASARGAAAQHDMMSHSAGPLPTSSGQAAFAAVAEVVRLLDADPSTDWSKVNIEALRQHLIDMDDAMMRSRVVQHDVPGGMTAEVIGTGRTEAAIRRVLSMHSAMLDMDSSYHASATNIPGGMRFTVTAKNPSDARAVARIRGLGVAGLFTEGNHHPRHHMAVARGEMNPHRE